MLGWLPAVLNLLGMGGSAAEEVDAGPAPAAQVFRAIETAGVRRA
jgi:hypothetical protein